MAAAVVFLLAAGCAAAAEEGYMLTAGIAVLLYLCFLRHYGRVRKRAFFLLLFYFISYHYFVQQIQLTSVNFPIDEFQKISASVEGSVVQIQQKESGVEIFATDCHIVLEDGRAQSASRLGVVINLYDGDGIQAAALLPGDRIKAEGKIYAFPDVRNDGGFDRKMYYRSLGMSCRMSAERWTCTQKKSGIMQGLFRFKNKVSQGYDRIAQKQDAAVLKAIVLGDKTDLDSGLKELYQKNGIAHLLAISGLHVSLIGMLLYRLLKKTGVGFPGSFVISMLVLVSYAVMTGNGISVRRAVIMCVMNMGAQAAGRTYDLRSALSAAAIWIVHDNVWVLCHSGFQLSFGAILGIAVLYPSLNKLLLTGLRKKISRMEKKRQAVRRIGYQAALAFSDGLLGSLSVSLMTLPVILYNYFEVPVYSTLLNMIVIPLMSVLMICALAAGIISLFFEPAGIFLMGTVHVILDMYSGLCRIFESLPGSIYVAGQPKWRQCVLYFILIAGFVIAVWFAGLLVYKQKERRKRGGLIKCCTLIWLTAAVAVLPVRKEQKLVIDMIDVGQGDCILVRAPGRVTCLFDGGSTDIKKVGDNRIFPLLHAKAITRIDYIFISHSDEDHINGVEELLEHIGPEFSVGALVLPGIRKPEKDENYCRLVQKAQEYGVNVHYVNAGQTVLETEPKGKTGMSLFCLHPGVDYDYKDTNDYSAVYLLRYGSFSMLLTGDVEESGEKEILSKFQLQMVSVLKTAHHGSNSSTSLPWLSRVNPRLALISCGINNRYGHPASRILERLTMHNSEIFVTAGCGQITVKTDGTSFWVRTKLQDKKGEI